jgi:hypothetical protein
MNMTIVRTGATVLISVAVAMQTLHPAYTWLAVIVAAASAVGIHAIPAVSQAVVTAAPTVEKVIQMSENEVAPELANPVGLQGSALMGVTAPKSVAPVVPVADPVEAVAAPDPAAVPPVTVAPETAQKTATPVSAAPVMTPQNELKALLTSAAALLNEAASKLD